MYNLEIMKKTRKNAVRLLPLLLLASLIIASYALAGAPAKPAASYDPVTLKGQVVCSACWGEDDRKVTPYGSEDDIKCAKSCNKRGVPPGLAVKEGEGFSLYILAEGKFSPGSAGWVGQMGKYVETSGPVVDVDGKKTLKVNTLKPISAADAGFSSKAAS